MTDSPHPTTTQPRSAHVVDLRCGRLANLTTLAGVVRSGIRKQSVAGPVWADRDGFEGDLQGDRVNHGGADKAICVYPAERYAHWTRRLDRPFGPGDFGENLTLRGLDERSVCIGDLFELGAALVQVSQPRQPCYRLAALHGLPQLAPLVQRSGFTGWYLRVLRPGHVESGQQMTLLERPWPQLTIAEANRVVHHDRGDLEGARRLLVPELSASWTRRLTTRLERGDAPGERRRLTGTD